MAVHSLSNADLIFLAEICIDGVKGTKGDESNEKIKEMNNS